MNKSLPSQPQRTTNSGKKQAPVKPAPQPASNQPDMIRVIFQQDGEEVDACEIDLELHDKLVFAETITKRPPAELLAKAIEQFTDPIIKRYQAGLRPSAPPAPAAPDRVPFEFQLDGETTGGDIHMVTLDALLTMAEETGKPLGALAEEAFADLLAKHLAGKKPLPALLDESAFETFDVRKFVAVNSGTNGLSERLEQWVDEWYESADVVDLRYQAEFFYEATRFNPIFRKHARALQKMMEGGNELRGLFGLGAYEERGERSRPFVPAVVGTESPEARVNAKP